MTDISEFVVRRDVELIEERMATEDIVGSPYPCKIASDEHFARLVAEDVHGSKDWRCYFYHGGHLLAVLYPLEIGAIVNIREIEEYHDHLSMPVTDVVVYGLCDGGRIFRSYMCYKSFGFLMSYYDRENITNYGGMSGSTDPDWIARKVLSWAKAAVAGIDCVLRFEGEQELT